MTRDRKPSGKSARPGTGAGSAARSGDRPAAKSASRTPGKSTSRPVTRSARNTENDPTPGTGSVGRDGKLHIQPGSVRKPKTDSRPRPASRRRPEPEAPAPETEGPINGRAPTSRGAGRSGAGQSSSGQGSSRQSNSRQGSSRQGGSNRGGSGQGGAGRQRGPQLDSPPSTASFRDRDGKTQSFPDSALKRIAAQVLTAHGKKWRYRPFGFPIFSASGSEQEMHFDFYVYDNMDSIFKLILLMPRESREVWDRVGRFKTQYPMYHYELWTPEHLAKVMGPHGKLGW